MKPLAILILLLGAVVFISIVGAHRTMADVAGLNLMQAYPKWGFVATFVVLTLVMRQILVVAPRWVFVAVLLCVFVLWTSWLIAMRPA
jgi:hypothetical protein